VLALVIAARARRFPLIDGAGSSRSPLPPPGFTHASPADHRRVLRRRRVRAGAPDGGLSVGWWPWLGIFRDWTAEAIHHPNYVVEAARAISDKMGAAYRRATCSRRARC